MWQKRRNLTILLLALCGTLAMTSCGANGTGESESAATGAAPPAFKPITSEGVRATLARLGSLYQSRAQEISARAVGGNFRLAGADGFVPADLSYIAARIQTLLDTSRPAGMRLDEGAVAVTVLVAGYRTTEMPEFAMSARDVLDYVRSVLHEAAPDGSVRDDFESARLTPLEKDLSALETACSCR